MTSTMKSTMKSWGASTAALSLLALAIAMALLSGGCARRTTAHVAVARTDHDFGELWIGEVVTHDFRIENDGVRPLELGSVRSSCGCLLHKLSSKKIEPGGHAEVTAELHADKAPGRLIKMLNIETNDPERKWLELTLAADLKTLYELDPPLLDAQQLVLGEPAELIVKLKGLDGSALTFGTPECPERGFGSSVRNATRDQCDVVIHFHGATATGRRFFHVTLPTGHPKVPAATIGVQAVVLSRLQVGPGDRVDFGEVKRAEGGRIEMSVKRRGKEPLPKRPTASVQIPISRTQPNAPTPDVTAQLVDVVEGEEWTLVVSLGRNSLGTALIGRVTVHVDAPNEPPNTLTLTGRLVD